MRTRQALVFASCLVSLTACIQTGHEVSPAGAASQSASIEGYWQDAERRVLFTRNAPSSATYGKWAALDPQQTYPLAKHVRRTASGYDVIDLNYDSNYSIRVLESTDSRIAFTRSSNREACRMHHDCRLEGSGMFCSLENKCQEAGAEVLDWRGEERYVRRVRCERVGRTEAQGIPVRCQ